MNKNILIAAVIFLLISYIAYPITTFVVQETEKVSLVPKAEDPDSDALTVSYSEPLNNSGEWQTSYGDAGEYKTSISVSDGSESVSEEVLIIVTKKEEAPEITLHSPAGDTLSIDESQSVAFEATASDLNKDRLDYAWFVDGEKIAEGRQFVYEPMYKDAGRHKVSVSVSDGEKTASKEWHVDVADVDVESLLAQVGGIEISENEIARLQLPDFAKYGLSYRIAEPLGNKNEWKTGYDDAGSYEIEIEIEGKGFKDGKTVKLAVSNVDRAPVFYSIEGAAINENEEITIELNAEDPDDDRIEYSASGLPEGAELDGNEFRWVPSYDTVKKDGISGWIKGKLIGTEKKFYIQFIASSNGRKAVQDAIITVRDVNRAPVLEDMSSINANEGDTISIVPQAYDPDGDKISLAYSGFMDTDTFTSGFDDAGIHEVRVTATDGSLEASKNVAITLTDVNRAPQFGKIEDVKASENDNIVVLLDAYDRDNDPVHYSIDNPPEGSYIKGNAFFWTPGFNLANGNEVKKYDLAFVASDNRSETRHVVKAEVGNRNRAPKITNASGSIIAGIDEPVFMFVKATDEDNDFITYTWDFGILDRYKATENHQRVFTTYGLKEVKVIVSDGIDEVVQIINVNVV